MAKQLPYSPDPMTNEAAAFVVKFAKANLSDGNDPRHAITSVMMCCAKYLAASVGRGEACELIALLASDIVARPENYPTLAEVKKAKQ
jgi:hypothetical protein